MNMDELRALSGAAVTQEELDAFKAAKAQQAMDDLRQQSGAAVSQQEIDQFNRGPQDAIDRQVMEAEGMQQNPEVRKKLQLKQLDMQKQQLDLQKDQLDIAPIPDYEKQLQLKQLEMQKKQIDMQKQEVEMQELMQQLNVNPWQMMRPE